MRGSHRRACGIGTRAGAARTATCLFRHRLSQMRDCLRTRLPPWCVPPASSRWAARCGRGPVYVLHAVDPAGEEVRVIVDAQRGQIVKVIPLMAPRYAGCRDAAALRASAAADGHGSGRIRPEPADAPMLPPGADSCRRPGAGARPAARGRRADRARGHRRCRGRGPNLRPPNSSRCQATPRRPRRHRPRRPNQSRLQRPRIRTGAGLPRRRIPRWRRSRSMS